MSESIISYNKTKIPFTREIHGKYWLKPFNFYTFALNSEWSIKCMVPKNGIVNRSVITIRRKHAVTKASVMVNFSIFMDNILTRNNKYQVEFKTNSKCWSIALDYYIYRTSYIKVDVVIFCSSEQESRNDSMSSHRFEALRELSDDFARLLDEKTPSFADVQLKCGSLAIPAHRNILSARSPVFRAMFSNKMKETRDNEVHITDIDAPVLQAMLTYVYSGQTGNLSYNMAGDLLYAADKYELIGLKTVMSDYLKSHVSVENVLKVLLLGDLHAQDLKDFALNFIQEKCAEFSILENTKEWKMLVKERSTLAIEVLTLLVKSNEKK